MAEGGLVFWRRAERKLRCERTSGFDRVADWASRISDGC